MSESTPTIPEGALPGWVRSLQVLAPLATAIGTTATNPKEWLETFIRQVIAEWFVGLILDGTAWAISWFILGYATIRDAILTAIPPLVSPFAIMESTIVFTADVIYGAAESVAHTAGLAGPPAAAFAVMLVGTLGAMVTYGILKAIPGSDFVEGALGRFDDL